jgi:hypothetical protein
MATDVQAITMALQSAVSQKHDNYFTRDRLEDIREQRLFLENTGRATLTDIHGNIITFVLREYTNGSTTVTATDTLGNKAVQVVGPDDAFTTWYNSCFIMCDKDPDYGSNWSELRKIQRHCPFEIGVWKEVPLEGQRERAQLQDFGKGPMKKNTDKKKRDEDLLLKKKKRVAKSENVSKKKLVETIAVVKCESVAESKLTHRAPKDKSVGFWTMLKSIFKRR